MKKLIAVLALVAAPLYAETFNLRRPIAYALRSATTNINISSATAPTSGQVLTATSGSAATWQTPSAGSPPFSDATALVKNAADATKTFGFDLSGLASGEAPVTVITGSAADPTFSTSGTDYRTSQKAESSFKFNGNSEFRLKFAGLSGVALVTTAAGDYDYLHLAGVQLTTPASQPTCDATARGTIYYTAGASLTADKAEICAKSSLDTYAWRAIATIP